MCKNLDYFFQKCDAEKVSIYLKKGLENGRDAAENKSFEVSQKSKNPER